MNAITQFFEDIANFFVTVVDFVIGLIEDLIFVVMTLGNFLSHIPEYFGWLPGTALILVVGTFSVVVIYMVLNRK